MIEYRYIGCFFDREELFDLIDRQKSTHLCNVIEYPHITFEYRPSFVDESLFGEKITVRVLQYANNGTNEGVRVELYSENSSIQSMIDDIENPHITLSVSANSEPVNTAYLEFTDIEPFEITGTFGGYDNEKNILVLS